MVAEKFPMSKAEFYPTITKEQLVELCKDHCCMFRVAITNLVPLKHFEHPISLSKCRNVKEVLKDNGRIITAAYLETTITEQDFFTYEEYYDWEDIKFFDCYAYKKDYLPTPLVKSILKFYKDKTELKGVAGSEVNYLLSKEQANSCFGMMVTDIVREELEFSDDEKSGCVSNYTAENFDETKYIEEQIKRYNSNPYRFLFYPWGVWVTAYARSNLFSGISAIGSDYIYSDTDSLKILNNEVHQEYFEQYNYEVTEKLRAACEHHKIPFEDTRPKNKDGIEKPLGIWDFEGIFDEFKTLGAKRYMYRENKKWTLTCAGVNKITGRDYLLERTHEINKVRKRNHLKPQSPLHLFTLNLIFPKGKSGRTLVTYIDEETEGNITDYLGNTCDFHELSSIHMEEEDYSLNPVDGFIKFLFNVREEEW